MLGLAGLGGGHGGRAEIHLVRPATGMRGLCHTSILLRRCQSSRGCSRLHQWWLSSVPLATLHVVQHLRMGSRRCAARLSSCTLPELFSPSPLLSFHRKTMFTRRPCKP